MSRWCGLRVSSAGSWVPHRIVGVLLTEHLRLAPDRAEEPCRTCERVQLAPWSESLHSMPQAGFPSEWTLVLRLDQGSSRKQSAMTNVGNAAPRKRPTGEMPSGKWRASAAWPAGFGALAITVRPPPATAPATTAYRAAAPRPGTSEARYVIAALSFTVVRAMAPKKRGSSWRLPSTGAIHHC